jgi:hypothetical protein
MRETDDPSPAAEPICDEEGADSPAPYATIAANAAGMRNSAIPARPAGLSDAIARTVVSLRRGECSRILKK